MEGSSGQEDNGDSELVKQCLYEAMRCFKNALSKPYVNALVKLAAGVPLNGASLHTVKELKLLTGKLNRVHGNFM